MQVLLAVLTCPPPCPDLAFLLPHWPCLCASTCDKTPRDKATSTCTKSSKVQAWASQDSMYVPHGLSIRAHWLMKQLLGQNVKAQSCKYSFALFPQIHSLLTHVCSSHSPFFLTLVVPFFMVYWSIKRSLFTHVDLSLLSSACKICSAPSVLLGSISYSFFQCFPRKAFLVYVHIPGGWELNTITEPSGSHGEKKQRNKVAFASNTMWSGVHRGARHSEFWYPWLASPGEILFSHTFTQWKWALLTNSASNATSSEKMLTRHNFLTLLCPFLPRLRHWPSTW